MALIVVGICPLLKLRTSRERFYIGQPLFGEYKANEVYYAAEMNEGRKRVLLIAATILAAHKLAQYERPCPAVESAISDAISTAELIMAKIHAKYPEETEDNKSPYQY